VENRKPRGLPIDPNYDLPKLKEVEVNVTDYMSIIGSCLHIAQVLHMPWAYYLGIQRHQVRCIKRLLSIRLAICSKQNTYISGTNEAKKLWTYQRPTRKVTGQVIIPLHLITSSPLPEPNLLDMFCDADYSEDKETRRSTSCTIVMMNGGPISWSSRLQRLVALTSAESEIYVAADSVKEALFVGAHS
jgi:hypothetical protein